MRNCLTGLSRKMRKIRNEVLRIFPDIYLLAAEKMNVPIEDCYIFEDSDNGVLGAVRSGGKTIMVTSLGEANDFAKEHCIGIFNDMHEALTAIKDGTLKK